MPGGGRSERFQLIFSGVSSQSRTLITWRLIWRCVQGRPDKSPT